LIFQGNGPYGTDLHAGKALVTGDCLSRLMTIESDECFKPPVGKVHERGAICLTADLNAFSAKDTPVGIVAQERMIIHRFLIFPIMFQAFGLESHFQKAGDFLQFTFFVGRTMAAIHMVYGQ